MMKNRSIMTNLSAKVICEAWAEYQLQYGGIR